MCCSIVVKGVGVYLSAIGGQMLCLCGCCVCGCFFFFFQAEDGIRDHCVTGVQTCALPICRRRMSTITAVYGL